MSRNPKAWHLVDKGSPNDPKYSVINILLDYIYAHTQWKVCNHIIDEDICCGDSMELWTVMTDWTAVLPGCVGTGLL